MVKNTFEMFQSKYSFYWKCSLIKYFLYKKKYWVSCFKISFYDNNVNQMSEITRNQMRKFDKLNYSSKNGKVEKRF